MKKTKSGIKFVGFTLIVVVILIFSYIIYRASNLIQKPTETFLVENGKLSLEDTVDCYIIREEEVVSGEEGQEGIIEEIANEGEKVAKGDPIFRYVTSEEEAINSEIDNLKLKINDAIINLESGSYSSRLKIIDQQIDKKIIEMYAINNIQTINEYKRDLNTYIDKKIKIANESIDNASELSQLVNEKEELENEITTGSTYINSPNSGVVSYRIDGLEESFDTNDFSGLSKEGLDALNLKTGEIISSNKEKGKVINNYYCYLVCFVNNKNLGDKKEGKTIKVRLPGSNEVKATIQYLKDETQNSKLMVLKVSNGVEDLINYRKIPVDVIWWSDTGWLIPNTSIHYQSVRELRENALANQINSKTSTVSTINEVNVEKVENVEPKINNNGIVEDVQIPYIIRKRIGYSDKIYVKIVRQTDKYSLVENYKGDELKELGLTDEDLKDRKLITLYDSIEN